MPIKLSILPFLILFGASVLSCSDDESRKIDRLDLAIADSTATLSKQQNSAFDAWTEITGIESTPETYRTSDSFRFFAPIVKETLPPLDSVERVLSKALANISDNRSQLFGMIIPYNQSVVTHPSGVVLIGLNHYLGADHEIYSGFPEYERRHKELKYLPANVIEAVLAGKYPAEYNSQHNLLNEMLYHGALLQTVLESMPKETKESVILGMTDSEYAWCKHYESNIWNTMIEQQLLYSASESQIKRLIGPASHSTSINPNAPGRTAIYIGLKIVQSYLNNNRGVKAQELLTPTFYNDNSSLIKSNYTPKNATN